MTRDCFCHMMSLLGLAQTISGQTKQKEPLTDEANNENCFYLKDARGFPRRGGLFCLRDRKRQFT